VSDQVIRTAFDVLSLTSILVLLVLGMAVIISMMGVFNLAHGELVLLGALTVYLVSETGLPVWVGMVIAPIVIGVVGLGMERSVIRRFYSRPMAALLATWALGLMIREIVRAGVGARPQSVESPLTGTVSISGVSVSEWRLLIIVITPLVLIGAILMLKRTGLGMKVRATLDNPPLARASGIATSRIYAGTFAFGAALAGLAGALIVPLQSLYPELGTNFLMQSFLAVMVGGFGSFEGPIVGATTIGVPTGTLPLLMSPVIANVLVFVAAIALMRFRPGGLLAGRGTA
jgi:branched-chain amino acid transport system permease protein